MIYPQNFEQKIGFDSIRHLLKEKCLSTLGQERVDEMNFSESFKDINEWLEQVMEFIRIIQEEDSFPDQYFFDVRPSLKRIRVEGMYLDEQELFDLRRSLETIRDIIHFLTLTPNDEEQENSPYPALQKTGRRYYRVSSTHYAYKQHLRQIRKNQRQRFFRIITHPQRVGLDSRKHITQFECNSTQRSSRRLC